MCGFEAFSLARTSLWALITIVSLVSSLGIVNRYLIGFG